MRGLLRNARSARRLHQATLGPSRTPPCHDADRDGALLLLRAAAAPAPARRVLTGRRLLDWTRYLMRQWNVIVMLVIVPAVT